MRKYAVEFIGTFFLMLTIGLTVAHGGAGVIPPLAIGSMLMVMVYAGGHISGAHYNPAVTLAVFLRGKCEAKDVPGYMGAQVAGASAAAFAVILMKGAASPSATGPDVLPALLAEVLFTFALAWVVLNVATAKGTQGNSNYGLAIGFTVLAGAFAAGPISGGVFNPAVAIGVSILHLSSWGNLWIFLVANFAGGALAGMAFKALNPE